MKSAQIRTFFWSVFSLFGLNTEIYSVNLRIKSEYGKIRTRKNSGFGRFSRSERSVRCIENSSLFLCKISKRKSGEKHKKHNLEKFRKLSRKFVLILCRIFISYFILIFGENRKQYRPRRK